MILNYQSERTDILGNSTLLDRQIGDIVYSVFLAHIHQQSMY